MSSNEAPGSRLSEADRHDLLDLARGSIRHGLRHHQPLPVDIGALPSSLAVPRATFVTLEIHGNLRGCIGTLEAARPLAADVVVNAFSAAFRDRRFQPVSEDEVTGLEIHISVLTSPEPMCFSSENELLRQLRPGEDGLILEDGVHRGTFLPSVWEALPEPCDFLRHLKLKAGLPESHWSSDLRVQRYRAEVIRDER
jgi:AmmeMemoRadiSam system protein A